MIAQTVFFFKQNIKIIIKNKKFSIMNINNAEFLFTITIRGTSFL